MTDDAPRPKAIIFDLDEALVDSRPAWVYAVEETVMSMSARRENARPLVAEYRRRPLWDVFRLLLGDRDQCLRAERMATTMLERSALKKLLVHEGVGMALDELRMLRIEMGAISRLPHGLAIKHLESTGLDRFFAVLSPTPKGEPWVPAARITECLGYLGHAPGRCAFVSGEPADLSSAEAIGLAGFVAEWAANNGPGDSRAKTPGIARAADVRAVMMAAWATGAYA